MRVKKQASLTLKTNEEMKKKKRKTKQQKAHPIDSKNTNTEYLSVLKLGSPAPLQLFGRLPCLSHDREHVRLKPSLGRKKVQMRCQRTNVNVTH